MARSAEGQAGKVVFIDEPEDLIDDTEDSIVDTEDDRVDGADVESNRVAVGVPGLFACNVVVLTEF